MKWLFNLNDQFVDRIERLEEKNRCFVPSLITIQYLIEVMRDRCLTSKFFYSFFFCEKNKEIDDDEADGLFVTEVFVRGDQWNSYLIWPSELHGRLIYVSHLYTKVYRRVSQSMKILGLSSYAVSEIWESFFSRESIFLYIMFVLLQAPMYFDAVYFQRKAEEFKALFRNRNFALREISTSHSSLMFYRNGLK